VIGVLVVDITKNNHTYYFIRYAPAAGGSHLANLLSLDPTFAARDYTLSKDDYVNFLKDYYSRTVGVNLNVHIKKIHGLIHEAIWLEYIKNLDYSFANSVSLGHAASFDWSIDTIKTLKNKKFISITMNDPRSVDIISYREKIMWGTDTLAWGYYRAEIQHFYNRWFVSDDLNLVDDDINLLIEFKDMYYDIDCVIDSINKKFNLDIPIDQALLLHKQWIKIIGYS
jgi:hypothetical protein